MRPRCTITHPETGQQCLYGTGHRTPTGVVGRYSSGIHAVHRLDDTEYGPEPHRKTKGASDLYVYWTE